VVILAILRESFNSVVHCRLCSVSFPITASSAKGAVQCQSHKGQLIEVKKHMPNVIKSIVMCYKGFCGIHCQINSYVCAGLTSNHWHKEFIPGVL
jgi:hypothetical protein